MSKQLKKVINSLPRNRRTKIKHRVKQLVAELHTIRDLRKAKEITQARLAKVLNIGQDSVSRLEQRTDLHISTLKEYVNALGGYLRLIVEFPNHPPIELTGFGDVVKKVSNGVHLGRSKSKGSSNLDDSGKSA